jgi:hypothetical protein
MDTLLVHHDIISTDKFHIGKTDTLLHKMSIKTEDPVYVKQFNIPDVHRQEVEKHVT